MAKDKQILINVITFASLDEYGRGNKTMVKFDVIVFRLTLIEIFLYKNSKRFMKRLTTHSCHDNLSSHSFISNIFSENHISDD